MISEERKRRKLRESDRFNRSNLGNNPILENSNEEDSREHGDSIYDMHTQLRSSRSKKEKDEPSLMDKCTSMSKCNN